MKHILSTVIRWFKLDCQWRVGWLCYRHYPPVSACNKHFRKCQYWEKREL